MAVDEYVEWRAREEGVDAAALCARHAGRAFDAARAHAAAAAAVAEAAAGGGGAAAAGDEGALAVTELLADDTAVRRKGGVSKRGSGRGLFSSIRWKPKLLVLTPGGLCYFDSLDEADPANKVSRMIPLDASVRVQRLARAEPRGPPCQLLVTAHAREYLFGCESDDDASGWVAAIALSLIHI